MGGLFGGGGGSKSKALPKQEPAPSQPAGDSDDIPAPAGASNLKIKRPKRAAGPERQAGGVDSDTYG